MSLKSSWAHNNGKRMSKENTERLRAPEWGWIERKGQMIYAERNKYNEQQLMVKTYANKTQANNKVEKLKKEGVRSYVRAMYPYLIIKEQD